MAERQSARTRTDTKSGWISIAVILAVAILFGAFVLPRLTPSLEGQAAPDFALPIVYGGETGGRVRLSEQRGKLVLIDFWASWCKPCRAQNQILESIRKRYVDAGVVVIGVNVGDAPSAAKSYLEQVKPSWVVVEDTEGAAATAYKAETLPTIVAIDREGKVFAVRRRLVPERELAGIVEGMTAD